MTPGRAAYEAFAARCRGPVRPWDGLGPRTRAAWDAAAEAARLAHAEATRRGMAQARAEGRRGGPRPIIDKAELRRLREEERWTWRRIATQLGCTPSGAWQAYAQLQAEELRSQPPAAAPER
jgi:DNA invertase Pin-like site-specific DNA recombinase